MKPFKHQEEKAEECWVLLKEKGYVYLAGKPRSGKTLTSILIAEKSTKITNVLVLTKKAAIPGWQKFTTNVELGLKHKYTITNYEQAHKLIGSLYQLVIIDESHNLGTLGKPSLRIKTIKKLCYNMPHIHLSGTAIVESANSIYHQMFISKYKPFKHKNFYDFFREFGEPYYIKAAGRDIAQYDKFKPELLDKINEFTVYMTQEDAGISSDVQATDVVHYVELDKVTKKLYNTLQEDNIIKLYDHNKFSLGYATGTKLIELRSTYGKETFTPVTRGDIANIYCKQGRKDYALVCDTTMKLRTSLHMLESGVAKIDDEYIELGNLEKIEYVKKTFGDTKDVGIMCHFVGERNLLSKHFKFANIYSSSAHAEGVDLSHLKHFVILSSDYSGSKFIQRRDRIVNINGSNTTVVNHILVKKAISEQVYKKVSKKEDFNNSTYDKKTI